MADRKMVLGQDSASLQFAEIDVFELDERVDNGELAGHPIGSLDTGAPTLKEESVMNYRRVCMLALLLAAVACRAAVAAELPNIIFIMVDDMGTPVGAQRRRSKR